MRQIKEYDTVHRTVRDLSFRISRMEDMWEQRNGAADSPHRHSFYTVLLLVDAEGIHNIDYHRYPLASNSLFFVSPGQVHQVVEEKKSTGFVLLFSSDFLVSNNIELRFIENLHLFRNYGDTPPLLLTHEQLKILSGYCEDILVMNESTMNYKAQGIASTLKLFLIHATNWASSAPDVSEAMESGGELVRRFRELVEQNFHQWHNIAPYAKEIGISADHLNRTLKMLVNKTAKEFIQTRIAVESQRLLMFSPLSTKEISYALGFSEPGNFSAFFKKRVGVPPATYKKTHQNGIS